MVMISQATVTNWCSLFLLSASFLFICQKSLASSNCIGKYQGQVVSQSEVDPLLDLHAELLDDLEKGKIQHSELFSDKRYLNLCGASLDNLQFEGKNLRYANFQAAKLNKASFYSASLEDGNLQYVIANEAVFNFSNLENANFIHGELIGAYFNSSNMEEASLNNANINNAEFYDTYLKAADLSSASIRNATFILAYLHQADLTKTDLSGSSLRNATLSMAEVDFSNFTDVELRGAKGFGELKLSNQERLSYPMGLYEQINILWASGFKQEARELNYLFQQLNSFHNYHP